MLQKFVMAMLSRRFLKIFPKQIGSTKMILKVRTYYHPRIFHLMSLVFWGLQSLCSPTAALGLLLRIYAVLQMFENIFKTDWFDTDDAESQNILPRNPDQ
jgi:hypothetical protein